MTIRTTILSASALVLACAAPAGARVLDPDVAADAVELSKRVQCGVKDGEPAVYHWSGKIYSRVDGERDRLLFHGEGMNIRRCVAVTDPQRGTGYRLVSREVMFFTDPETGQIVRQWKNPWTGEMVDVMHIANDPVNGRPSFPVGADGKPFTNSINRVGNYAQMPIEVPLFYTNPLAGEYQEYVGGTYHAMEIFDFAMPAAELFDTKFPTVYPSVAWVRISKWMPWMKMGDRQGEIVFNAMGAKLKSYDELPAVIKDEIAANYPIYNAAPSADDQRPNETTWTVFKKKVDTMRAKTPAK